MGHACHPPCKSAKVLIVGSTKTASIFYHQKGKKKRTLIICAGKMRKASFSHLEKDQELENNTSN